MNDGSRTCLTCKRILVNKNPVCPRCRRNGIYMAGQAGKTVLLAGSALFCVGRLINKSNESASSDDEADETEEYSAE